MKKHLAQIIGDMAFQKKLVAICLIVSLIPMAVLGIFFYNQQRTMLTERAHAALQETLRQEADHINHRLESYLSILDFIAANNDAEAALTRNYTRNYDMYIVYRDIIDPLLETMRILYPDLLHITFYSSAGIYPHGTAVRPVSDISGCDWYRTVLSSTRPQCFFSEDQKTLLVARQVYLSEIEYTNVLVAFIDVQYFLSSIRTVYEDNFGFFLFDQENLPIYRHINFQDSDRFPEPSAEQLLAGAAPDYYAVQARTIPEAGWTAVLYRPILEMRATAKVLIGTMLSLVVCSSLLVFFLSAKLTELVILPLTALSESMRDIEQGKYELMVKTERNDEIGQLIHAFDAMVRQQNHLVNEVLYAKIACQKYELRILQAQINPHFLYNSLSLISSKAILCGQQDIRRVAQLLSTFYRTMLNSGKTTVTISEELDNVKSYISIQQIMHSDSFEAVYEIDPSLLECCIPNMLLQPLAENAILHGLDSKDTPGMGILTITCYAKEDDIYFKVMDNGRGMTREQCENIIRQDSRGYGVKNVHQRIQLYYGSEYGINFHSVPGRGCCALLKIRKSLPQSEIL